MLRSLGIRMKHQWSILLSNRLKNPWLKEKCLQLTYSNLQLMNLIWGHSIDEILEQVPDDATHLSIVKIGCYVDDPQFVDENVQHIDGIAGHILNYEGEYPFFHDQFLTLSLNFWRSIGRPSFDVQDDKVSMQNYQASNENWHDHYTPKYLTKSNGSIIAKPRMGSLAISKTLEKTGRCDGLNEKLRRSKLYLYPHHGIENDLINAWQSLNFSHLENENHRRFFETYYKPNYNKNYFWPYNTENQMAFRSAETSKIRRILAPASGFLAENLILNSGLNSVDQLIFYDISPAQLKFKSELMSSNRRITDYKKFILEFAEREQLPLSDRYTQVSEQIVSSIDRLMPQYYEIWNSITHIEFHEVDLIDQPIDFYKKNLGSNSLLHVSNIFLFSRNHIKHSFNKIYESSLPASSSIFTMGDLPNEESLSQWESLLDALNTSSPKSIA